MVKYLQIRGQSYPINILWFLILFLFIGINSTYAQSLTEVDLQLTKTVKDNTTEVGGTNEYEIKVKNLNKNVDATGVKVLDLLPEGVISPDVRDISNGTTYNSTSGIWDIGTIEKDKEVKLKIRVTVGPGTAAKTIVNTASIYEVDQYDPETSNNRASATFQVKGADIAVVKTVDNISPSPGDPVVYTIVVTNNGPDKAKVVIKDLLPQGLTYQSSTKTQGDNYNQGSGIWNVKDINSGSSATLTISATVNQGTLGQTISNTASVYSSDKPDSIIENNSSTVDIYVLEADLGIAKAVDNSTPEEGDTVTYTITYTNNSAYDAPFVKITDFLPDEVTYVSDTSPGGGYNPLTGTLHLGTLAANSSGSFDIVVTVNSNTGGMRVDNIAEIFSPAKDTKTSNNQDTASFQVSGADLEVTKTVDKKNPSEGDEITYTVTLTNHGPDTATDVIVDDIIPNNLDDLIFTLSQGTYDHITEKWEVGSLTVGQTETMTVRGTLIRSGTFINTAIASANENDGNQDNNRAQVTVNSYHTFSQGAAIIDMGISPQTYNNGLKPYGLVYELSNVHDIPVYWSIKPDKTWGDGTSAITTQNVVDEPDFTVNGKEYKGGPFIIAAEYLDAMVAHPDGSSPDFTVRQLIEYWMGKHPGLTVDFDRNEFVAPLHDIISRFPRAVLDTDNGKLIRDAFYTRARLYEAQFSGGAKPSFRIASPSELTNCDDMFALPHADPHDWDPVTEQVHLKDWIKGGGYLWMACHAVSSMEGMVDIPDNLDPDGQDMRLLSKNGMVLWKDHGNEATPPFDYSLEAGLFNDNVASDPFMQFIGKVDGALSGGSEEIYIVNPEGYRPTTVFPVRDLDHPETQPGAEFYPGPAASVVYGRAFSNPRYGMVMYEASHSIAKGTEAENVAAARIYGNMLLQGGIERNPKISEGDNRAPNTVCMGESFTMDMEVSGVGAPFTYEWTSSCGGTFSGPTTGTVDNNGLISTTFTAPEVSEFTTCIIRLKVTDSCGRESFFAEPVRIVPAPSVQSLAVCLGETFDLAEAHTRASEEIPPIISLEWYTTSTREEGTKVDDPTQVGPGTYYAFYVGACETPPASEPVIITERYCLIAENDINQTPQATPVSGNVLTNDYDPEGKTISITEMTTSDASGNRIVISNDLANPTDVYGERIDNPGVLVLAGTMAYNESTGKYDYVPTPSFIGKVNIEYAIEDEDGSTDNADLLINVIPNIKVGNNPPIANNDTNTVQQGGTVTSNILSNDSDPDGDSLTVFQATGRDISGNSVTLTGTPQDVYDENGVLAGQASINSNGEVIFTANNDFVGKVPIDYSVEDANGGTDSATLTITVKENDGDVNATYANDDANTGPKNQNMTGNVLDNDTDPEGQTQVVGRVDTTGDGIPDTDVSTGTSITLPSGGILVINPDGSYDYTPAPGFVGTESVVYEVNDQNGATDLATLYLTTLNRNSVIATNDINQTPQDVAVNGSLFTNDINPDGDLTGATVSEVKVDTTGDGIADTVISVGTTTAITFGGNSIGSILIDSDGTYTFTPASGFVGDVPLITYEITDIDGDMDTADLTITVVPAMVLDNNPPIANNDTNTVQQGGT
ncbi:Ig-like domain-containing protein, partial [Profundicola chukchiensis]